MTTPLYTRCAVCLPARQQHPDLACPACRGTGYAESGLELEECLDQVRRVAALRSLVARAAAGRIDHEWIREAGTLGLLSGEGVAACAG